MLEIEFKQHKAIKPKCLKWIVKILCQIKKMKNTQSTIKPIKIGKQSGTTYCLGWKDYTHNFRPEKVRMTNKVLRGKISLCCFPIK